jgi:hypothetical protein
MPTRRRGIPHFESKYLVEKHVAGLGIPYTISAGRLHGEHRRAVVDRCATPGDARLRDASRRALAVQAATMVMSAADDPGGQIMFGAEWG